MKTRFVIYRDDPGGYDDGLEITREASGFFHVGKVVPVVAGVFLRVHGYAEKSPPEEWCRYPVRTVWFRVPKEEYDKFSDKLVNRGWTQTPIAGW